MTSTWDSKHTLLAIDPGNCTGWAFFARVGGGWTLQGAGVAPPDDKHWPGCKKLDQVVIEAPTRPNPHTPRPADILTLSRTVGRYIERFSAFPIELVEPHKWKGSVPKEIFTRRILAALSGPDRDCLERMTAPASQRHNMVDAVGLGYWAQRQPFMREPRIK